MRQRKNKDGEAKFRGRSGEGVRGIENTMHLALFLLDGGGGEAQEERMILDSVPEKSLANRESRSPSLGQLGPSRDFNRSFLGFRDRDR